MASGDCEKDEMGSLFEGMVLFNPSQMVADEHDQSITKAPATSSSSASVTQPLDENLFSDLTLIAPLQTPVGLQPQSDPSTSPTTSIATRTTSNPSTTTTTSRQIHPSSVSRQISTRKKKRAGLRIGYGRDAPILDDDQSHSVESELPRSSPLPSAAEISSDGANTGEGKEEEEEQEQEQELEKEQEQEQEEEATSRSIPSPATGFPYVQPYSHPPGATTVATTTTAVENDLSDKTSGVIDSSHSSIDNGVLSFDKSVSDAEPAVDVREEEEKQVTISSPIELRFEQNSVLISEKLKLAGELVDSVSCTRKESIRRRRKAAENVSLASTKYRDLEKELEEACETEDFETAERVSESLASADKEKELLAVALKDAEADCDAVDYKLLEVLEWQIAAEEECASLLQSFAMELSSSKSSIQQEIESFKQRLLFIDKRVPELEAEKKVAATARNFKDAARIASDAKALCVEKEGVQIKMEEAKLELGQLEEEIGKTVNRLQETEVQISSKEKELAMARIQRLLLIVGAATAERSAALELGDLEEADILLAEAEAADSEAKKLKPVYNLEEGEFANLPKQFISMELVSNLGRKQLAELVASAHISAL